MVELYLFRVVQDHIFKDRDQGLNLQLKYVHTGVSGCEQGFITCFLEVPLASLSCSSAPLPVELSENMLQNLFHNLMPQTVEH